MNWPLTRGPSAWHMAGMVQQQNCGAASVAGGDQDSLFAANERDIDGDVMDDEEEK